jgi:protein tyrosine phosphatase (PTP) superfamily phosphohydrolase (DUF442 family)
MVYAMSLIGRRFLHDGKGQWMTLMDDQIAVSSLPLASDLPEMQAAGVIGVVNMCAETAGPADAYEEAGIQMIRCPILDTNAPDLDTIKRATFFITQKLAAHPGKRVLIHCKGGRGRAATIALCYYISQGGVPADIIKMLKAKRDTVEPIVLQYNSVVQFAHLVKEAQTTK